MKPLQFRLSVITGLVMALFLSFTTMSSCSDASASAMSSYVEESAPESVLTFKAKLQPVFNVTGKWVDYSAQTAVIGYIDPMFNVGEIVDFECAYYRVVTIDKSCLVSYTLQAH